LGERAKSRALREHGLEHGEDRIRGFCCCGVADEIGEFFATCIHGAHVSAEVVHEDFGRIRATVKHFGGGVLLLAILVLLHVVFHLVEEALHDPDVVDVV